MLQEQLLQDQLLRNNICKSINCLNWQCPRNITKLICLLIQLKHPSSKLKACLTYNVTHAPGEVAAPGAYFWPKSGRRKMSPKEDQNDMLEVLEYFKQAIPKQCQLTLLVEMGYSYSKTELIEYLTLLFQNNASWPVLVENGYLYSKTGSWVFEIDYFKTMIVEEY